MTDPDLVYFKPGTRLDPTALHEDLLGGPSAVRLVTDHSTGFAVVGRYDDVVATARAHRTWGNGRGSGIEHTPGGVLGGADQPDHTRQRRVLQRAFTPRAIMLLEPRIVALTESLLDTMLDAPNGDVVAGFAHPLPAIVIGELFGVPPADRSRFKDWATDIVNGLGGIDQEAAVRTRVEMGAFLQGMLDDRLARLDAGEPVDADDDVFTRLAIAHRAGQLSADEIVKLGIQLLVAGHETTTSLLGFLLHRMATTPGLLDRLVADPIAIETAIEEAVRLDGPVQGIFRTAETDQVIDGVALPARTKLQVMFATANRDPAVWHDPLRFDLDRSREELARHVGFGHGIHHCIGAPLARMEARVAISAFVRRVAKVELLADPEPGDTFILRGYRSLMLGWSLRTT